MMNKGIVLASALLLSAGSVMAEPSKQIGIYVAAGAGITEWDDDNALPDDLGMDDTDSVGQVIAGYKFNGNFAIDARYAWLGSYSVANEEIDFTAWSVNAVGMIPLPAEEWEVFGQLGLGRITGDGPVDDNDSLITGGAGVRYNLSSNLSLSGQMDFYWFSPRINGSSYDNTITTLTAGVQYIFE